MSREEVTAFLENHPRMTGALFMMVLLLSQAGAVVAKNGDGIAGP